MIFKTSRIVNFYFKLFLMENLNFKSLDKFYTVIDNNKWAAVSNILLSHILLTNNLLQQPEIVVAYAPDLIDHLYAVGLFCLF